LSISPTHAADWRKSGATLRDRVVTALLLAAGFLGALFWLPPLAWTGFAAGVGALAAWEWAGFARCPASGRIAYAAGTVALLLAAAYAFNLATGAAGTIAIAPVYALAAVFWLVGAPLWLARRSHAAPRGLVLGAGWMVLLPGLLALIHLRNLDPRSLLAFMALVWIADIAAYFVGRRFGRHKLAPSISPGKSWEGLAAALAAAAVYGLAWMTVARDTIPALIRDVPWSAVWMLVLVVGLAALSVIGDLFESAMKRQAGLKDSGGLLPGHGGVLDRIDALTPVVPVAALVSLV
jgi:phosphatidate cytidylyltransferase